MMDTCTKCGAPCREEPTEKRVVGFLLKGVSTINVSYRLRAGHPYDHQETRRYCSSCTQIFLDLLREAGFDFSVRPDGG